MSSTLPDLVWSYQQPEPPEKPPDIQKVDTNKKQPDQPEPPEDQYLPDIHRLFLPTMATADQVRLIINQTLGNLGPLINDQGGIVQGAQG